MTAGEITIELFGIPRARAGRGEVVVRAATVRAALAALSVACPGLGNLCRRDGGPAPHYLLSLDGQQFVTNPDHKLQSGDRLLLLSADAGG